MRPQHIFAVGSLAMLLACQLDSSTGTSLSEENRLAPPRKGTAMLEPEPDDPAQSPLAVSLSKNFGPGQYEYIYTAVPSGSPTGHYELAWMVSICDTNDYCGYYYQYAGGTDMTTFTYSAPESATWMNVHVLVRVDGDPNYYSVKSNQIGARGPLFGQYSGGSITAPCQSAQFPLAEVTWDTAGHATTRYYTRNVCNGHKEYAP